MFVLPRCERMALANASTLEGVLLTEHAFHLDLAPHVTSRFRIFHANKTATPGYCWINSECFADLDENPDSASEVCIFFISFNANTDL